MWVSNTWVMRTPCCEGEGEDTVEVALRVDHQRDPAIMDKVAAVTKARGVDRDDLQHLSQPLPYPQGYTSHDARSATGPQPPVGTESRWVPRPPPRSTGVQHRRGSPAKQDDQPPTSAPPGSTLGVGAHPTPAGGRSPPGGRREQLGQARSIYGRAGHLGAVATGPPWHHRRRPGACRPLRSPADQLCRLLRLGAVG